MDSLPDVDDAGLPLVDAEGKAGVSACVRFARQVRGDDYQIGQRVEVEGVMRTRIVPGRVIGVERFEAVFEIEVRDAREFGP